VGGYVTSRHGPGHLPEVDRATGAMPPRTRQGQTRVHAAGVTNSACQQRRRHKLAVYIMKGMAVCPNNHAHTPSPRVDKVLAATHPCSRPHDRAAVCGVAGCKWGMTGACNAGASPGAAYEVKCCWPCRSGRGHAVCPMPGHDDAISQRHGPRQSHMPPAVWTRRSTMVSVSLRASARLVRAAQGAVEGAA
jgi:hypothetical protein